ncbi:ATP-binding protein [Streptomyces sp. NPDC005373]|uniref:ATP-binding protein n=1 Tax=Streptomyces sp. NPDC005373 TaxID=3156879 RepID=UPI0033A76E1C
MKTTVPAASDARAEIAHLVRTTPPLPSWIFSWEGWDRYVRTEFKPPDLLDCAPAVVEVDEDDPRVDYHRHLLMIETAFLKDCLLRARGTFGVNGNRYEGLLDMVIDGPAGTGKTYLLRLIGRELQRRVEKHFDDRVPVVHITVPYDPENKLNWIWEIASFLALTPEPKSEAEARQSRRIPDLSLPVHTVMERKQTRLLLVDDIQRVSPSQLAPVLHYFDYLHTRLGITTIFCGTGATDIVHAARKGCDRRDDALWTAHQRLQPGATTAQLNAALAKEQNVRSLLPVTWVDPLPWSDDAEGQAPFLTVLKGYEKNLRMRKLSKDVLTQHAGYLHDRTGGYFLHLSQLICGAAVAGILDGSEDITREHLEAIRVGREEILLRR